MKGRDKLEAPRRLAPRRVERGVFDLTDATVEPDFGSAPESVFERATGPVGGSGGGAAGRTGARNERS